jgi:hypothetical protein
MIQPDVPVALLDPGLDGTLSLTTFAGHAVDASCFRVKVTLDGLKETDAFLGGRPTPC